VANTAKIATIRPQTMSRAQNKSDLRFYCIFKDCMNRAFWTYTNYYTNSGPRDRCAHKPVKTTCFDPQTPLHGAYTPPTCSECADLWWSLHLAVWAFQAQAGLLVRFPPKTQCGLGQSQKRCFDPQTPRYGAYTQPTCSKCADHWWSLQLATHAFRA